MCTGTRARKRFGERLKSAASDQNDRRSPSWIFRPPFVVEVTCPKFVAVVLLCGAAKLGVLNALKNSPLNCALTRSVTEKFLTIDPSRLRWPGDVRMLRPALPK